jgi:PIN domain nuclease of toxin-antitoxin system
MLNLDTHILLYALGDELNAREKRLLSSHQWSISAIVLWELSKLTQLGRITLDIDSPDLVRLLAGVQIWPRTFDICKRVRNLDFKSDPADEVIAATTLVHGVPLLTRDRVILRSKVVRLAH